MKSIHIAKRTGWLCIAAVAIVLSSCYKKYDPKSYAPAFTIGGFTKSSEIAASNLVGYWAFDGSLIDSVSGSASTNVGTSFAGGFKGQALKGALNAYVLASPSANFNSMTSFTVSEWVNTPPPSTGIIDIFSFGKTDGFWGNIDLFFENGGTNANGRFRTHIFNGTDDKEFPTEGGINFFDNWTNVTITYDGTTSHYLLYINGSKVTDITATGFGPLHVTNPGKLILGTTQFNTSPSETTGSGAQSWASFLTGSLDEVRVYNKVLTALEINALTVLQGKGK
ncbi:MAG: LamG domain-containing protein [Chitinophagaceae bacterium]